MNATQFWQWGGKQQRYADNETVIEITTTSSNETFEWGIVTGTVQYYDWGNGIKNNNKSHTFANAGVYTIKIVGDIDYFRIKKSSNYELNPLVTKILQVAGSINNFYESFYGCINITSIPQGLFDKNVNVGSFVSCFWGCAGLTSIPQGLFDKNINVTRFDGCFFLCTNLTSIPQGLFDKNVNVIYFTSSFAECKNLTTVPIDLFDKNIKTWQFIDCFHSCISLKNRPKPHGLEMWQIAGTNGRPAVIHIGRMFTNCHAMPDYNSLPASVNNQ
ncbi:hypothetical protein [Capnocytophaga sp. H2931]|uniref:hypothetical protein n=1 Tax=Capnocytophaga sp. H2931 TaxID=1945657 RepID=UPI000BB1DD53|nr:hypothetical protein [Capnocytophaga sp. H2931]ATA75214.1 hypothetical protein CGC52_07195 [Capnocytophaga sp. H2931]